MALGALRTTHDRIAQRLAALVPQDLVALAARFGIGATFWLSGRTKMEGVIAVTDGAIDLFREEFRLPLIDPVVAAHMAAWAETLFPMLLFLGLFTRLSAAALLFMTLVIQVFVYPDAWPTHLGWAAIFLYLLRHGAGRVSVDHAMGLR
jgi:putative oxidoreductase